MTASKRLSALDMNGTKVTNLADGTDDQDAATKAQLSAGVDYARALENKTGSITAAAVSDFNTAVRTSSLDQLAAPASNVTWNSKKITDLADPSTGTDAANKQYVDNTLSGAVGGLVLKGIARVYYSATSINISTPGASVDGVTLTSGDVIVLGGQSTGSQNGAWVFNGSSAALTRPTNYASGSSQLGAYWLILQGTSADLFVVQTNDTAVTVNTGTPAFVVRGNSSSTVTTYAGNIPAITAGASGTVTHNLNSRDVLVQVVRTASPYDAVDVRVERATVNTVTVSPDVAVSSSEFRVLVQKM